MASRKGIGFLAGAGVGAAAAAALRRRWSAKGDTEEESAETGPYGRAFLEHLAEAIRIPTVGRQDGIDEQALTDFREFLASTYPLTHERLTVEVVAGHSLLFRWDGADPALLPILLMGHMDVVPVEPGTEGDWPFPPFAAQQDATHLWGRGAVDDKGAVVAMFEAVESLLAEGHQPEATVYLSIGHDEETGGSAGASAVADLLASRGVRCSFALDEGGSLVEDFPPGSAGVFGLLGIGEKGYLDLEIVAVAEGGHSSVPPRHTAVGRVAAAVAAVEANPLPARVEVQARLFRALADAMPALQRFAMRRSDRFGTLLERKLSASPTTNALIRTTGAVTMVSGGVKANVLPQTAAAVCNFRILPGDTIDDVIAHVRRVAGHGVEVRVVESGFTADPPPLSDPDSEPFRLVAETIEEIFPGAVVAPWILMGATDSRHFMTVAEQVLRFVPFRLTPDDMGRIHGTGERVRLGDADAAVAFYRLLVRRAAG